MELTDKKVMDTVKFRVHFVAQQYALTASQEEDLLADCIAHLVGQTYDPDKGSYMNFIVNGTMGFLRNWKRHENLTRQIFAALTDEEWEWFASLPHNSAWRRERRLNVVNCVEMLSPLAQKVCDLHMDKLSLQEIAAAVKIAERTFFRKTWPSVKREFKLSWKMMGFNESFNRTTKKGQDNMNQIQETQLLGALVRDCHQPIDEMIAAGDVRVIRHLANSYDLGDHTDFLDFCAWCKRVRRFGYVKAYLVNGSVSEAAKEMSLRLGHRVSTKSVLEVLSWLVKNFPW